ncbi:unnamed protein product [Amoebophrya sp. A120]|nr:unnamed protein product [Amoebophrya sp. A120]|eukprot:GSA120T00011873001.1
MASFKSIPVITPYTYSSNMGPGSEHGGPFYPLGQQYHQPDMLADQLKKERNPPRAVITGVNTDFKLDSSRRLRWNDPKSGVVDQCTMYTYGQPDSHRSCVTSYNKDGLTMNSLSHYNKVGAKHLQAQSRSSPIHSYFSEPRRKVPDIGTKVWDNFGIDGHMKATSEEIGNWSPLWYRAVNDMNVYANLRPDTMKALGLEYEEPGVRYGMINGEFLPKVEKVNDSARSSAWSENHKYVGYPKEPSMQARAYYGNDARTSFALADVQKYMSPVSIANSDPTSLLRAQKNRVREEVLAQVRRAPQYGSHRGSGGGRALSSGRTASTTHSTPRAGDFMRKSASTPRM